MAQFKGNPKPIDPDVQVPEAVRRAAAAADAAMQAANPQPPAAPTPPAANNDTITIVEEPPQRLPGQVPLTIEPAPPPPPPAQPVEQPHTPTSVPPPAPDAENGSWEQKYNSILGRYRDATQQLSQQNTRIEALENMLAVVQAQPRTPAPAPAPAPEPLITDKDREEFGPDMLGLMERVARQVVQPLAQVPQQLDDLRSRLTGVTAETEGNARARMLEALTAAMPNWNEINHDADFHAWLALRDPFSGAIRHNLLREAYGRNDTARVLAFFKSFVSDTAALVPAAPTTAAPPAQQPVRPTLEELAAPGRARTAASPQAPAEKQIITTKDVNAFYAAVRQGKYRGREAEQKQLEAELFQAMQEGRVVQNT